VYKEYEMIRFQWMEQDHSEKFSSFSLVLAEKRMPRFGKNVKKVEILTKTDFPAEKNAHTFSFLVVTPIVKHDLPAVSDLKVLARVQ